jgi:hypothetical protein
MTSEAGIGNTAYSLNLEKKEGGNYISTNSLKPKNYIETVYFQIVWTPV